MNPTKLMTLFTALFVIAGTQAPAANFVVNPKVLCTHTDFSAGSEKLVRETILKTQLLQMCVSTHPEVGINDVELAYDSEFGILHVIRKCDGTEVCEFGTGFCVQAFNGSASGATEKLSVNSQCVLELFFFSPANEIFGTALGKEKLASETTNDVETKLAFKASYQGHFELFTFDDVFVCTIKFATGARFEPTGGFCPE